MGFLSEHVPGWSWSESLAAVDPGHVYQIDGIAFSIPRERCRELDIEDGMRIRPLIVSADKIVVELMDGEHRIRTLERPYGWYVHVEPVGTRRMEDGAPQRSEAPLRQR